MENSHKFQQGTFGFSDGSITFRDALIDRPDFESFGEIP